MKSTRRSFLNNFSKPILNIVIIFIVITWLVPTVGLFISSLRPAKDVLANGWWNTIINPFKSKQFTLNNYIKVIGSYGLGRAFLNSLIIALPSTFLILIIASLAAFALAFFDFPKKGLIYTGVIGLLVVPLQMTMIPVLKIYNALGLAGTFVGLWLAHVGYGLPFAVFLLHNFFSEIPRDFFEAAYVDGASTFTIFRKIIIPLSTPAIASLTIFQFLWVWNDLLVALIYLGGNENVAPLTVKISSLVNSLGQDWHLLTAGAFISMVIPIIIFFVMQRYFVRGILTGAIKG
jgi:alpha-glucoside transport system permease protein